MQRFDKEILKPWCIVIIDDSPDDCVLIRSMLLNGSERRLTFIEAGTAAAGISAVLGAVPLPDCIVLDYNLPDMDAPEVLAALTGPDGMPVCPVVVITGIARREDGRRVLRAGAQDYIGKDWTSAPALTRAIENASESWAMAHELHQRKNALRLVTDRETFRSVFGDATRGLLDEYALKRVASHMLGVHLQVNRVVYAEVDEEGFVLVGQSYANGVQQLEGRLRLEDYGPTLLAIFQAGENVVAPDIQSDLNYSESEKAAYAQIGIAANLSIPILKNGQLLAVLGVHQNTPRNWTPKDITIAQEIAERTWSAVEHARSEEKLKAKELQLSQMLQIMPSFSAVVVGPTFIFQMANHAYYDLVARGQEIIGKTVLEALPEIADQPFPALLEQVYRTGNSFEAKAMVVRLPRGPDRRLTDIFVDFAYLPLREASGEISSIFIHGVDRTVEVMATQALAQSARELRSVTENTPDGLARFDSKFWHVFVNSVIEKYLDLPVAQIFGKTHRQLGVPVGLCDKWEQAICQVFEHQTATSLEIAFPTSTDGVRQFSCRLVPEFNERKQVVSVLGVTHDITDRRIYEQRLLEQDIRKDEFLATLAHELRNPLAPIRSGLQLLKLTPKLEVAARTLPVMERQLSHLVRLVDDLLDVSRINSGKITLKRERVAFQDVAAAALEASRPLIDAASHSMTIDWPNEAVWLHADPTRLTQIFSNLLTNSAKYMRPGGKIIFSARQHGDNVVVSVQDTGLGIPADMLGLVFNMFTQINRTLDRAQGGLGIGLSLVKTLVEMHGGSVQATSGGFDLGSTFTVVLPTVTRLETEHLTLPVQPGAAAAFNAARHRILVVDDNVDAAETMVMLLELSGHDARAAFGGQEALDVARVFRPDVAFLDIGLPGLNGYEVARRLLLEPATASTKLIALTGWGTEDDIRKSKMAGFHAHLTKPVDPDAVEGILAAFFPVCEAQ
jgi:signal transduction histidine kinase/CheY-like chemotaxis protein